MKVHRFAGAILTGINEMKGKHKSARVVVCGSGTTLEYLEVADIPDDWIVVAVNEAIKKIGSRANYWVLSDDPIVKLYARHCPENVTILAMHQATVSIPKALPNHEIFTVNSTNKIATKDDGFNFYSRGTVLIGAIEMLKYMGAKRFYCFGLDCYRTEDAYYYDGRKPAMVTENQCVPAEMGRNLPPGVRIFVTSRLKNMVNKLRELTREGLWDKIKVYCVNSPHSQQDSIPKMDLGQFYAEIDVNVESEERKERRKREKTRKGSGSKSTGTKEGEDAGSGEHEGRAADNDGQVDPPVVSGAGDEEGQGGDSGIPDAEHEGSGDSSPGGDRDAHGEDVADADDSATAPQPASEVPNN